MSNNRGIMKHLGGMAQPGKVQSGAAPAGHASPSASAGPSANAAAGNFNLTVFQNK